YFLQPLVETEAVELEKAPYIKEYTELGVSNVQNLLKSKGHWNAQVTLVKEHTNHATRSIDITLNIKPGTLYKIAPPRFTKASAEDKAAITSIVAPFLSQTSTTENITKIRNAVENHYRNRGFHTAKISMNFSHRGDFSYLIFTVTRGKLWTVSDVTIEGDKKTKSRRIRRYFDALKDLPFDEGKADKSLKKLLATGAFKSATLTPIPREGNRMDLRINVAETKARELKIYLGMGSFEGFILGSAFTDHNFRGRLLRFNARGEYSSRGLLGEVSVTEPHFAGEAIQFTTRGYVLQRQYEGYNKKEAGIESSFTWRPRDEFTSRLYLGTAHVSSSSTKLTAMELGPEDYLITRVGFEQTLDWRDNPLLPSEGFYLKSAIEYGTINGDAATSYFMAKLDTSYRYPIGENHGLHARFSTGILQPGESQDMPIDLRLFSGGSDSVRSFDQRELGPRSLSNDPLGGEAYWNASLEYIHSINDPIKGVLFFDMGQVYANAGDWGFSDPSYALGLGLRIDLPIGPVRLEYGHNMNQRKGEPSGTFHFSIGTSF
ncbi:MAG: BamA/OMP85 family outer membrane protein, partial [Akkermansiaceae bacterium]